MEIKIVERDPKKLKFDPNQPRKKFNEEIIESMAKTYNTQGIINDPEIDENDVVITGEIRVKGAIKSEMDKIKCKQLIGLTPTQKLLRQLIENLHRQNLTSEERENGITRLYESGEYTQKQIANELSMDSTNINKILQAKKLRDKLRIGGTPISEISTSTLIEISGLEETDQEKMIVKILEGEIHTRELRNIVKIVKELPPDIKDEILQVKSPIDLETAKTISIVTDQEQRKELINEIKLTTKMLEDNIQYRIKIAKGEIPPEPIVLVDNLDKMLRAMIRFRINTRRIFRMEDIRQIESMEIRMKIREIIEDTISYLEDQLKGFETPQKILEIKEA